MLLWVSVGDVIIGKFQVSGLFPAEQRNWNVKSIWLTVWCQKQNLMQMSAAARTRLHVSFVFHDGHCARLGSHSAIIHAMSWSPWGRQEIVSHSKVVKVGTKVLKIIMGHGNSTSMFMLWSSWCWKFVVHEKILYLCSLIPVLDG